MGYIRTKIDRLGRVSIPASIRKELGVPGGGPVVMSFEDGALRIRSLDQVIRELQDDAARFLSGAESSSDALIAERRAEAARESEGL